MKLSHHSRRWHSSAVLARYCCSPRLSFPPFARRTDGGERERSSERRPRQTTAHDYRGEEHGESKGRKCNSPPSVCRIDCCNERELLVIGRKEEASAVDSLFARSSAVKKEAEVEATGERR